MITSRLFYAGLSKVFLIFYLVTPKGNDRLILYAVWCKNVCVIGESSIYYLMFNIILN